MTRALAAAYHWQGVGVRSAPSRKQNQWYPSRYNPMTSTPMHPLMGYTTSNDVHSHSYTQTMHQGQRQAVHTYILHVQQLCSNTPPVWFQTALRKLIPLTAADSDALTSAPLAAAVKVDSSAPSEARTHTQSEHVSVPFSK